MKVYETKEIRNIVIVGGAKSGKTTLSEAMLYEGGTINRRGSIEDGNTVSDYREIELERQNSIFSTVMYTEFENKKINIIDTPGFDDFVGEVYASLKVADTAVIVINAIAGIEVGTEMAWKQASKNKVPVIFAINHLEHEQSNFDDSLRQLKTQFGQSVVVLQYPVNPGNNFNEVIDIAKMKLLRFDANTSNVQELDIPASENDKAQKLHSILLENLAESDETLMETYCDSGTLNEEEIQKGLKVGISNRSFYPVVCINAKQDMGVNRLLNIIVNYAPAPDESPNIALTTSGEKILCDKNAPASAFVFKISIEPHLGEIAFFKLYSGELTPGTDLINANTSAKERLNQLFVVAGKNRENIERLVAGDIGATIKLKNTFVNNTLNSVKNPDVVIEPIVFPEPKYRVAVKAKNTADDEKLGAILNDMHKVDQTLIAGYSKELKQLILEGQGELHLNIVKWMIENINKIQIEFLTPKIPYRETITKPAKANYRHKKQSGGAGQFGEVYLMIEPYYEGMPNQTEFPIRGKEEISLPWGGKLVFQNCIVGGAIDARFMPAILKGIMEKIEEGPLTGSYARDIVVSVYDGKMHPVDSNEISFKLAGRNAFKEAFRNAGPKILEPIYDVEVICPEDKMGDVITDLQGRRAVIMGMESEGTYQKIKTKVPLAEMNRYSTALSSLTSGRATYSMHFAEYVQVPPDVQSQLLKSYQDEDKDE